MALQKRKTRMYEPWGYRDENNYESSEIIRENDLDSFFAGVSYKKEDNKIHFTNKDGEEVGNLDVNEFIKSDQIVERAWYENGNIYIKFTNGDIITIDVKELIDENEFADGLQVIDGVVSVLKDPQSEEWLTVSEDGVKVSGIQAEIDRLDGRIDDEISRATSEEERIESKLDQEIQDRIDDVDAEEARAKEAELAEETRAKAEELRIETKLDNEITRATQTEQGLNHRIDLVNDELDAEEATRESNDAALGLRIANEINDRIDAVNAEKARAEAAEQDLRSSIDAEEARAISAETELSNKIDDAISGASKDLEELEEKLGYKDNDTLVKNNDFEVAFNKWNTSSAEEDEPSGQTAFSVGIGTSEGDRKNGLEVRNDGSVYMWVEGEFIKINDLLAMLANEVYDTNP